MSSSCVAGTVQVPAATRHTWPVLASPVLACNGWPVTAYSTQRRASQQMGWSPLADSRHEACCVVHCCCCRSERAHMADGRRCNRWHLLDQHGNAHLAVIGIERDTKDGHYVYSAVSCLQSAHGLLGEFQDMGCLSCPQTHNALGLLCVLLGQHPPPLQRLFAGAINTISQAGHMCSHRRTGELT